MNDNLPNVKNAVVFKLGDESVAEEKRNLINSAEKLLSQIGIAAKDVNIIMVDGF